MKSSSLPVFIYGMGDGALKIISVMKEKGIALSGIFASDEFVRGHSFEGYKVHTLAEVESAVDDFIIVLAFAAGYQSLVDKINNIAKRHIVLAPDVPVVPSEDGTVFSLEYCEQHKKELDEVYGMLADEQSREAFSDVVNFRISGKIEYLNHCTTPKSEVYTEIIRPSDKEIYVDLGAYRGDTVEEFLKYTNNMYNKIYAVEPDVKNYAKLQKAIQDYENVTAINAAVWDSDTVLTFANKAGRHSALSSSGREVSARCVDSILGGLPCTVIKMDVEGAEKKAIEGACATIKKFKPSLMVSLYHRNEDIFTLPLLIKEINPDYSFYLRHQLYIPAWETNLYCV